MQRIEELYNKYLDDTITDVERQELQELIKNADDSQLAQLANSYLDADAPENLYDLQPHTDELLQRIKRRIANEPEQPYTPKKIFPLWKWLAAVSALAIIFSIGYYYQTKVGSEPQELTSLDGDDIPPGTNRATITLSDGTSIVLGEDRTGIATDGDAILYDDGTEVVGLAEVQYATLTTPVAGQYQVQLPDGSRAWLNAASSITYPTRFTGDERAITVTGEVFLEVAKDAAKPFVVTAGEQHIEVLGTSFNIDAYGDNRQSVTTLTEGRLKVINTRSNATVLLNPGQQAIVSDKEDIDVQNVDTQSFTAWKDGAYFLKDQSLSRFGKQIERWYDVDVDMGRHGNIHLSAMISRDAKLSTVLQAIELKTGITFKVEGRRGTAIE